MSRICFSALTVLLIVMVCEPVKADSQIKVVTSIKPVHSLVSGVMKGISDPHLIIRGGSSPHSFAMKPSDAKALENAELVFWIGDRMETFLKAPLDNLSKKANIISLSGLSGMTMLKYREGGNWSEHDHGGHIEHSDHKEHNEHHETLEEYDMHLWLDPENSKIMVAAIIKALEKADPEHATVYRTNGQEVLERLDDLTKKLSEDLAPVKNKSFIVFHDAFQYFENRFGLNPVGSVTVSPDKQPGAERLRNIRNKLKETGALCVFTEPQFQPKLVQMIIEGTKANTGVLDPLGAEITDGPDLYFDLMHSIARSVRRCLAKSS